jgi:multicomponent Na+:H+ antiporter subunit A
VILGTGLFLSASTALVPLLLGGAILEHGDVEVDLPIFGAVKITSALSFDLGVDFVVIGLILMAFAAFGEDLVDSPDASDDGSDDPAPSGVSTRQRRGPVSR